VKSITDVELGNTWVVSNAQVATVGADLFLRYDDGSTEPVVLSPAAAIHLIQIARQLMTRPEFCERL
jgi:hypothetical protein